MNGITLAYVALAAVWVVLSVGAIISGPALLVLASLAAALGWAMAALAEYEKANRA